MQVGVQDTHQEKRLGRRQTAAIVGFCLLAVFTPFVLIIVNVYSSIPFGTSSKPLEIDPDELFLHLTEWELPPDAEILENRNTHGGMTNDGDYTLIVRMPPESLQTLIQGNSMEWTDCPIAPEIARSAPSLPRHAGQQYFAQKTFSSDNDWHRGHLVIVNEETGIVWVYEWKL